MIREAKENSLHRITIGSVIVVVFAALTAGIPAVAGNVEAPRNITTFEHEFGGNLNFPQTELPPQPPESHNFNKTLSMDSLRLSTMPVLSLVRPAHLEAAYDEPISLREALEYNLQNNLPIKIARESWVYQRAQLGGQLAGFVPSFSSAWNLSHASIDKPGPTGVNTRVYQDIVRYPVFQGGLVLYGTLIQYYRDKSWHANYNTTINDSLLTVYQNYMNLLLNHALLHIRAKSVEVSKAQLELNNDLYKSGVGTAFSIMQSRTQLAVDRQALQQQQVATRQAAVGLAFTLNLPMAVNLVPIDGDVVEQSIIDQKLGIDALIDAAIVHRPELRQYELFRMTAGRAVQVAASGLYPQVAFLNAYTRSSTSVDPPTNVRAVNGIANAVIASSTTTAGTASNTALAQTASFSPSSNTTGNTGANTGAASVVAASGGNPMANVQSGNLVTSGAVAPAFGSLFNNSGIAPSANISGGNTTGAGVFPGRFNTYQNGFNLSWSLPFFGSSSIASIVAVRALTREGLVQMNQELQLVTQQVHQDYFGAYVAREQVDRSGYGVASSEEALRIAQLRLRSGIGTNLEVIQAERDYINELVTKAQSIVMSNQMQAQLLHDTGLISVEALTHG